MNTEQLINQAARIDGQDWRIAAVIVLGELGSRIKEIKADIAFNELENPRWPLSSMQTIAEKELEMHVLAFEQLKTLLADDMSAVLNG